jgi:hypothetical protein
MLNKEIREYIKEEHSTHPLVGCDIGEIRHMRVVSVLKKYPDLDYMNVSQEMDRLDSLDIEQEKKFYREWARRCID